MKERPVNRYFRTDIPLVAPEDGNQELKPRSSQFLERRHQDIQHQETRTQILLGRDGVDLLRGKRSFAYHVMALMVKKEYGDIPKAMEDMIAVAAEWEHPPFIKEVDGEICQIVPFSEKASSFSGGFQSTPAEALDKKEDEPQKVAFEWRTNLY